MTISLPFAHLNSPVLELEYILYINGAKRRNEQENSVVGQFELLGS